jgi:hypothetical protein
MASLEQLQMLDDEETSTSSSEEEEEEAGIRGTASKNVLPDVGSSSERLMANAAGKSSFIAKPDRAVATSNGGDGGTKQVKPGPKSSSAPQQKKRIRLSLGGAFKATDTGAQRVVDGGSGKTDTMNNGGTKASSAAAAKAEQAKKSIKSTQTSNGLKKVSSFAAETTINSKSHVAPPPNSAALVSRERPKITHKRSLPIKKKIKVVQAEVEPESVPAYQSASKPSASLPVDRVPIEGTKESEANGDAVEAVVIGNDEGNGEVDAVAAVIAQPIVKRKQARLPMSTKPKVAVPTTATPTTTPTDSHPSPAKKRAVNVIRTVRLPPLSSPALLIPPGSYRGQVNTNGLVAPNVIFAQAMEAAGYSTESRTKTPHRGSSVQREVGDMFDSDVMLCLQFPKLVPEGLLGRGLEPPALLPREPTTTNGTDDAEDSAHDPASRGSTSEPRGKSDASAGIDRESESANGGESQPASKVQRTLPERLIHAFQSSDSRKVTTLSNGSATPPSKGRKRRRIFGFSDMAPLSLTLSHPEDYIRKRSAYVKKVNEREKAIVAWQAEQAALEDAKERAEGAGKQYSGPVTPQIVIPPIPEPPDPPKLSEMQGMDTDLFEQDQHPLYPPKNNLVNYLDKNAFHIAAGRYFGLTCNAIADPHFVGPNCPGISGLNVSASTGLATASSVGGAGLGGPLLVMPAHPVSLINSTTPTPTTNNQALASAVTKKSPKPFNAPKVTSNKTTPSDIKSSPLNGSLSAGTKGNDESKTTTTTSTNTQPPRKGNGPAVTASASELRKVMEDGGEYAEMVKGIIIRGAVHAARAGKHDGRSFRVSNVKVYPDVCKAFASYAGIKPCKRCKSNKQGSYHCRLRRKHKDADCDGGDSWSKLAPYFNVPMAELVIKPTKPN